MRKWITPALSSLAAVIVSIVTYSRLPEQIAVHFGSSGTPDNYMNKPMGAFLLPVIIIGGSFLLWVAVKLEKDENKKRRSEATIGTLMAIISLFMLTIHIFLIAYNLGYEFGVYTVTSAIVGIVFILIGNILPRLPQGSLQWPRMSDSVRGKVTRLQGRIMMIVGLIFFVLLLFPEYLVIPMFFSLITLMIIALITSTIYYSAQERRE
jgi:uncharacterized membrane protein